MAGDILTVFDEDKHLPCQINLAINLLSSNLNALLGL